MCHSRAAKLQLFSETAKHPVACTGLHSRTPYGRRHPRQRHSSAYEPPPVRTRSIVSAPTNTNKSTDCVASIYRIPTAGATNANVKSKRSLQLTRLSLLQHRASFLIGFRIGQVSQGAPDKIIKTAILQSRQFFKTFYKFDRQTKALSLFLNCTVAHHTAGVTRGSVIHPHISRRL